MRQPSFIRLFVTLLLISAWPAFADPPARVGRVSYMSGQVSFRADKDDEWDQATLNYPVTTGNGFATGSDSRLEIRVGSAAIRVDEDSEISIPRLDDDLIRFNVKRGIANVTVRSRESRHPIEVLTPAGKVKLNGTGTYRFEADTDEDQVIVTAFHGTASLDTGDGQITIRDGREVVVESIDPLDYTRRNARRGPFEDWVFARDARMDRSRSTRYVSPEIAGHEDLDEYGDWQDTAEYGTVWVPRATVDDWAPYRYGRWAWVEPWGWTWIDYSPWGFAPFHYGRWVYFSGHWGWAPGVIAPRPVYAPALVAFVGRPGWNVSFSFGSAPAVGWVPLGYYDLYRPGYRCSPTYVRNINVTNINVRSVNVTNVNWSNLPTPAYSLRKFPHAVTVVPQNAFASGKPVINQAARLTSPLSEPVIGSRSHIPAPARRIVADMPGRQRPAIAPVQPAVPQITAPAQDTQQRIWPGSRRHPTTVDREDNSVRNQPRVQTAPETREAAPPAAHRVHPGREFKGPSSTSDANQPTTQERRQPHRGNDVQVLPRPNHPDAVRAQPIPEAPRPAPQRETFDGDRKHPHSAPGQMQHENRREGRPEGHDKPAQGERSGQEPGHAKEGHGVGRRRAEDR